MGVGGRPTWAESRSGLGFPICREGRTHHAMEWDEGEGEEDRGLALGEEVERGSRQDSTCLRPVFQEVPGAGPNDTDPVSSPHACQSCSPSTPGSVPRWPRPSSSAGCPQQWSGTVGRCARGPARGRGTPRRTRAAGTAISTVRTLHRAPAIRPPWS